MGSLEVTFGILIVLAVLSITYGFAIGISTKSWHRVVPFGCCALALFFASFMILKGMIDKPSSPTSNVGLTAGKDFCQVIFEEKTANGKTVVIIKDSSGNLYVSEFDEPLGVKKILVVEKERFQPLLTGTPDIKVQTPQE
ncbi:MAG: hypothetical protein AAB957_00650 [Patescibacteria group bacterium]